MHGFLLINKPKGLTSRAAMNEATRSLGIKKKGIEGILDPFADGLLIIGLGYYTRYLSYFHRLSKTYEAVIQLGVETDTLDLDGKITSRATTPELSEAIIKKVLRSFQGKSQQIPPIYSNAKVNGVPARKLARSGKTVKLKPRNIEVHALDLLFHEKENLSIRVTVSAGTYIRVLAGDIAKSLGSVGHLRELHRASIGTIKAERAIRPENVNVSSLIDADLALDFIPRLELELEFVAKLQNGIRVETKESAQIYQIWAKNRFYGLAESKAGLLHPTKILPIF